MKALSIFEKYLPADCDVYQETRGEMVLSVLRQAGQPLTWGCHHDARVSELEAVGRYLERSLPSRLRLEPEPGAAWAYGAQAATTRTESITRAVHRWAWNQWQRGAHLLKEVDFAAHANASMIESWLPDFYEGLAWQAELSFFESEAGILHLRFLILAMRDQAGQATLATMIHHENENPWPKALGHLWWQSQIPKSADQVLLARLKSSPGTLPWPALRVPLVKSHNLSEVADLPGFLYMATVEGEKTTGAAPCL